MMQLLCEIEEMIAKNWIPAFPVGDDQLAYKIASEATKDISPEEGHQWFFQQASLKAINGMSLLDYFAAKAMQGILSRENPPEGCESYESIAEMAYEMADAMLTARESK